MKKDITLPYVTTAFKMLLNLAKQSYDNLQVAQQADNKVSAMLLQVKKDVEVLQAQQKINSEDIKMKTQPAMIDKSLRAWFDEQIRQAPQVRGVDGKMNKER